jgi:hypothetical protein
LYKTARSAHAVAYCAEQRTVPTVRDKKGGILLAMQRSRLCSPKVADCGNHAEWRATPMRSPTARG